jgi:hypothetical protein
MAILIFVLSLILLLAALASGYMSLDLLPTSLGVLYALAGAFAACLAVVTFALGVVTRRIEVLTKLVQQPVAPFAAGAAVAEPMEPNFFPVEPVSSQTESLLEAESAPEPEAPAEETEHPINENRAGHLPTLGEIEHAIETPEATPSLVGRYSAGGASYMIFDDGSIEAETGEGAYKFASMGDFKRYLAERKGEKA